MKASKEKDPARLVLTKEKDPARLVLTRAEYKDLLRMSAEMDWRFREVVVIAHDTGHRTGRR